MILLVPYGLESALLPSPSVSLRLTPVVVFVSDLFSPKGDFIISRLEVGLPRRRHELHIDPGIFSTQVISRILYHYVFAIYLFFQ